MRKKYPILLGFDLQLFNDGGAGGAAAAPSGDGGAAGEASASAKADTIKRPGSSRRAKSGAYDNVVFGKQDAAAEGANTPVAGENAQAEGNQSGVTTTSDALEAKRNAFRDLTRGEYKDQFAEEVQGIINRRFKETKGMESTIAAQKPIMDILMQRYNIADGDATKLLAALEEDHSFFEDAAEEAGLTVEQYKAMQKLERENAELRQMRQRQQADQQAQQQLSAWMQEAETLKGVYPNFDLRAEIGNTQFLNLLKAKVPMQHAYELIHMDEIKAATARNAAQTASQQMQANIKAKASRPSENGTSKQSAVVFKSDVNSLTKADRAEAVRRAARGEKISF